jgi:hypothetical protein
MPETPHEKLNHLNTSVPGKLTESGDADSGSVVLLGLDPVKSTELPLELFFFRRPNFLRSFFTLGENPSFVSCKNMYRKTFHKCNYVITKISM